MNQAYTIAFSSFKNRIGRTLAMVKVGEQLAQWGKKVLLVELDLESPGLHTCDLLRPKEPHQGVVEYVTDYLDKQRSPAVTDYLHPGNVSKPITARGGEVWVMPAGRRDAAYWKALAGLDWLSLYGEHDGFLFFQDTWLQWQAAIRPDYVLIDAPCDNLGPGDICTRQLADAVALFVYADEPTLASLRGTCQTILTEVRRGRGARIALYAVLDNRSANAIPDEATFKEAGIELVSQSLEIHELTHKLTSQHLDRADVLAQLEDIESGFVEDGEDPLEYVPQLEKWASHFLSDEGVVTTVARILSSKEFGLYERALYHLGQAIECHPDFLEARVLRADIMAEKLGDSTDRDKITGRIAEVQAKFNLWLTDPDRRRLLDETIIADMEALLRPDPTPPPEPNHSYGMISTGAFQDVINYLESQFPDRSTLPTEALFNLAVAYWVARGDRRPDLLRLVVEQLLVRQGEKQSHEGNLTASEYQMLSLAYHGLSEADNARDCIQKAQGAIGPGAKKVRSYWRYGPDLDADLFEHDCLLQRKLIEGEGRRPHFFELM